MADEQNSPHRAPPSSNRAPQAQGQNDPLAELARLIGQNDPFSEFGRAAHPATAQTAGPTVSQQPHLSPHAEAREPPSAAASPSLHYHEPPAFIRATQEGDPYRDVVYRDAGEPPPSSGHYDDLDESRRGRGLRTAGVVIGLILIGTVAAFGYRFIFGGSGTTSSPPVIRANPEPTKVPPPTASTDAQGKSTYDRVRERAQGERVVSREETPVDLKDVVRPGAGRNPPQGPSGQPSTSAVGAPSNLVAPSALGEPKKVRTVTVRPNATDTNDSPSSLAPPPPAAAAVVPAPPQPSGPLRSAPTQLSAPVQQAPQQAVAPPKPVAAPAQPATSPANAPLTLNEDSVLTLPRSLNEPRTAAPPRQAPAPQKNTQVAAPPPQPLAQAPAKGGYLVQVSSQRSEADAQAALRSLQAKYPNVLGGQPATIRRAELGERGVFYRAMVGPYASREQAAQLCNNLKAAGGDCIVQGN